ncbi:MAG: YdcF family protein [Bacteroides sp.]|nr:YdcF family protein [Eubacterium sp.]MCM1419239.1 YdcF family protein [Roseburia sp.]MCM1463087.1 YdcF family protein [Bacteroides sp.]
MKKLLGTILLTACGLLLASFLATMLSGIVNQGNIIGSIFCLAVIFLYLYYPKLKEKPELRRVGRCFAALFTAAGVYSLVVSVFMISGTLNTPERALAAGTFGAGEPQTVIVLGCRAINGVPSLMLRARLDRAIEYLNENPAAVCIVAGGQGGDEIEPEGVSMRRYLVTNGISHSRIYVEQRSRNTRENIAFAKEIMDENALPTRTVIISEGYHVYRGIRIAERNGLAASAVSAVSTETWYAMPSNWIREILAVTNDYFVALFGFDLAEVT